MCGEGTFIFSSGAKYCGKWAEGNLIHYTDLETAQTTKTALSAKQLEVENQNSDIEKRLFDTKFDPSFELPETAAGKPSNKE